MGERAVLFGHNGEWTQWAGMVDGNDRQWAGTAGRNGGWWAGHTIKLCIHMITYWSQDQGERWAGCFYYATSYAYNGI